MKPFLSHYLHTPKRHGAAVVMAVLALVVSAPSFASPPVMDYAPLVTSAKNELVSALLVVGPAVFAILGILAAVGFAWKMFKRASKSS